MVKFLQHVSMYSILNDKLPCQTPTMEWVCWASNLNCHFSCLPPMLECLGLGPTCFWPNFLLIHAWEAADYWFKSTHVGGFVGKKKYEWNRQDTEKKSPCCILPPRRMDFLTQSYLFHIFFLGMNKSMKFVSLSPCVVCACSSPTFF